MKKIKILKGKGYDMNLHKKKRRCHQYILEIGPGKLDITLSDNICQGMPVVSYRIGCNSNFKTRGSLFFHGMPKKIISKPYWQRFKTKYEFTLILFDAFLSFRSSSNFIVGLFLLSLVSVLLPYFLQ